MDVADFDYALPPEAIAQVPVEPRDAARLLVDRGPGALPAHCTVADLPTLLTAGDVLVVNDSRVLPARLRLAKPTGGAVEVLLLERRPDGTWEALVRPSGRVRPGTSLTLPDGDPGVSVEVGEVIDADGRRSVRLCGGLDDVALLDAHGDVPLPPYITTPLSDTERYQTVFADRPGSVAAPTAGLHLTKDILARCRQRGVRIERLELQVGLGTFRPMTSSEVERHRMHGERYEVPAATLEACEGAERVVAVGTTVVRALESAAATGQLRGRTELFIRAGYPFRLVDALVTNFHVPRSSLLVLVDAFIGRRWQDLYATGLANGYRFLSFGDAMLLQRTDGDRSLTGW